jgi:hypothetical protein
MEQLIVLGEIPGTHIQITFSWYALAIIAGLATLAYRTHRRHLDQLQQQLTAITLGSLDQA